MDVAVLRAEIKAWEREFKTTHGRNPSVQEIKGIPAIAEKYKAYKKLSKQAAPAAAAKSSTGTARPPSTPPPQLPQSRPSSILPKSRAVKTDPPTLTNNPFSPVKNKSHPLPRSNPFATPTKANSVPTPKPRALPRDPSPDPFPLIQQLPPEPSASASPSAKRVPSPDPNRAVSRARKRLRGEPVSPSPVKEKRPRVHPHPAIPFPTQSDDDGDDVHDRHDSSFIDDSPVKPQPGSKPFIQLFHEAPLSQDVTALPAARRPPKPSAPPGLFANHKLKSRALSPPSEDDEMNWDHPGKIKALNLTATKPKHPKASNALPKAVLPGKDDLWSAAPPGPSSQVIKHQQHGFPPRTSAKRSLSDNENDMDVDGHHAPLPEEPSTTSGVPAKLPLLPPSPPPPDASAKSSSSRYHTAAAADKGKGKGRALAAASRKKAKLLAEIGGTDEDDEESPEDEDVSVKVVDWSWNARKRAHADTTSLADEQNWDPTAYRPARPPEAPLLDRAAAATDPGTFEVDLPDDLKRVLALSPHAPTVLRAQEEKVVRGLLYGSRELHYDAAKGGEIWDVGEVDDDEEGERADAGEDDWEGEPVPWEVGEL